MITDEELVTVKVALAGMETVRQCYRTAMLAYGIDSDVVDTVDFLATEIEDAMATKIQSIADTLGQ